MNPDPLDVQEEVVLILPDGSPPPQAITADGHVWGFGEEPDKRIRFHWDGRPGEPFDFVLPMRYGQTVFGSDDACHVAYMGVRDGKGFVGRDDSESQAFEDLTRSVPPVFSARGEHLAYGAREGAATRLFIDGALAGVAELAPVAATFSPDGRRLAYAEMRGSGRSSEFRIVLDGSPGEWFIGMRNAQGVLQFSPDGARFAYYRIDGKGSGQWVVDGVAQRWVDDTHSFSFDANVRGIGVLDQAMPASFSPDSTRFAYFADVKEKGVAVVEDDAPGPLVKESRPPRFSPDSRHLAYAARSHDKRWFAVRDGQPSTPVAGDSMGDVAFSPDSAHLAWTQGREEGGLLSKRRLQSLFVDDVRAAEVAGGESSLTPVFRSDSSGVAWWVQNGSQTTVYIGSEPGQPLTDANEPASTATGRIFYAGVSGPGSATVYVDHHPGPIAEAWLSNLRPTPCPGHIVSFEHLIPNGDQIVWAGVFDGQPRPVMGNQLGPPYDNVLGWDVAPAGKTTWWTQRGRTLYQVKTRAT